MQGLKAQFFQSIKKDKFQFFQSIKKVVKAELSDAIKKGYESFASL